MSSFDALARYYDADYGSFDDDVPFYLELARRTGGPILELMCGSGRLLEPLARAGYQLTGIDHAEALLARAQQRLAAAGLLGQVRLVAGDVRSTTMGTGYPLAIVGLNSFMHLEQSDDQLQALRQIHAALAPGGLLALDLFNPHGRDLAGHNGELVLDKSFNLEDGTVVQKFVAQTSDSAAQLSYVTFIYDELTSEGLVRRFTLPFTMRWLYRYEAEHLLARAGFVIEQVFGSYELDDYHSDSDVMLILARRRRQAKRANTASE